MIFFFICLFAITLSGLFFYQHQLRLLSNLQQEQSDYSRHYAFIGDKSNTFLQNAYEAAKEVGESSGDYVEFMGANLDITYSTPELMSIAIAAGVDGIIVSADDSTSLQSSIDEASAAGIPVVCIGGDVYGSSRKSYIGVSYYMLGQEYGRQIAALATSEVQNVLILTSPTERSSTQNLIYSGILDYMSRYELSDLFSFESRPAGDGSMFSAAEAVTDLFSGEDLPQILVCLDETTTTAACQEIVDSNHVGDVSIFGYYMNSTIQSALSKRIMVATIMISAADYGTNAVQCLDEYIDTGFVTEFVSLDFDVVTPRNLTSYTAESGDDS